MGQPITVVAKPSSNPGIVRYETNRAITGMGHERYHSLDDVLDDRPVDELARRILEHGGVDSVHVNSNVITVRLAGGSTGEGLDGVIGALYLFYPGDDEDGDAPADDESDEAAASDDDVAGEEAAGSDDGTEEAGSDDGTEEAVAGSVDEGVSAEATDSTASDTDAAEPGSAED